MCVALVQGAYEVLAIVKTVIVGNVITRYRRQCGNSLTNVIK